MTLDARVAVRRDGFALDVDLAGADGEVIAVLGPNGAGKSTLLRALAGLICLDDGHIEVGGVVWDDPATRLVRPPERRRVGLVFSDHLLFPHLSALENVAFGPRARGVPRSVARAQARTWLDRVGLADHAARRPDELSGGQAQRVALARALVTDPELLLLDEPLAALDASTRAATRRTLHEHLTGWPGVCVLVTHDPVDATLLADRVVLIDDGVVVQAGTSAELARAPRTPWAAQLLGLNVYQGTSDGTVVTLAGGGRLVPADAPVGPVVVTVPPTAVALHPARPEGSPRNVWPVTVAGTEQTGHVVRVRLVGEPSALADLTRGAVAELDLRPGVRIWASVKATEVVAEPL